MPEDVKTRMRETVKEIPKEFYPPPVFNQIRQWKEPAKSMSTLTVLQMQLDFLADEIENLRRQNKG